MQSGDACDEAGMRDMAALIGCDIPGGSGDGGLFGYGEHFWRIFRILKGRDESLTFILTPDFLNVYELLDDHYRIYAENVGVSSFKVRLFCVDPSSNLSLCMAQGNSTILFSADDAADPVLQDIALRK